jgi:hypothetical protein
MIPHDELAGRVLTVIVCHLDDSGEDREPVVTLAGYVGTAEGWASFEERASVYFADAGIEYLHTVDLHQRRGEFRGWTSAETMVFAKGLFEIAGECIGFGVEFSVLKTTFNGRKVVTGAKREGSALTFCLKGLLERLTNNQAIVESLALAGVDLSFVVESGRRSEPMVLVFNKLKAEGAFGGVLRSLVLEDKKKLYALQISDFLAFFCRRIRCMSSSNPKGATELAFFNAATAGVKHHNHFLAIDFGTEDFPSSLPRL